MVPTTECLSLIRQLHDSVFSGHLGTEKTAQKLRIRYYWPGQDKDVRDYVLSCDVCAKLKAPVSYFVAPLQPIKPVKPWQLITTDIMGPLPVSELGNKYILVVIDHFSGLKYLQ